MKTKREYINEWFSELKKIVLSNIDTDKYVVFLFGLSVNRESNFEDVDIGILGKTPVPEECISQIGSEIDDSVIPYRYVILDFLKLSEEFRRKVYSSKIEVWNKPVSIELNFPFQLALADFETSLNIDLSSIDEYVKKMIMNGQVNKFEYAVEVLGKTLISYLKKSHGLVISTTKQSFKEIFNVKIIDEITYGLLFEMLERRHYLKYANSQKNFEALHKKLPDYLICLKRILRILENNK